MELRLARIHAPVTTLGPGRRVGIWFQGCSRGCEGCMSRDTWPIDGGTSSSVEAVAAAVSSAVAAMDLDGVTVSGGEPFEQPEAFECLLECLRSRLDDHVDLLAYSGLRWERLRDGYGHILRLLDAVIADPFMAHLPTESAWRGSSNQRLVMQNSRFAVRYESPSPQRSLQLAVDDGGLWVLGIPRRGDLERLERHLSEMGVELDEVSWR